MGKTVFSCALPAPLSLGLRGAKATCRAAGRGGGWGGEDLRECTEAGDSNDGSIDRQLATDTDAAAMALDAHDQTFFGLAW